MINNRIIIIFEKLSEKLIHCLLFAFQEHIKHGMIEDPRMMSKNGLQNRIRHRFDRKYRLHPLGMRIDSVMNSDKSPSI